MSAIINATPALRFIEDLNGALYRCGYDSTVDSLHQANPEKDQWNLHLTVTPHTLTGKCARIALQLDNIAENGPLLAWNSTISSWSRGTAGRCATPCDARSSHTALAPRWACTPLTWDTLFPTRWTRLVWTGD